MYYSLDEKWAGRLRPEVKGGSDPRDKTVTIVARKRTDTVATEEETNAAVVPSKTPTELGRRFSCITEFEIRQTREQQKKT